MRRRDFLKITGVGGAALVSRAALPSNANFIREEKTMAYTAKDYSQLVGLAGFSETLLKNHFTLYQGYVTNTNKVLDALAAMLKDGKTGAPEFAELKRRLGWEFNCMRLHQYFFENLGGKAALRTDGRLAPHPDHGCLRARLHDRLRPEAGRLHRGLLQEHRLAGGGSQAEVGRRYGASFPISAGRPVPLSPKFWPSRPVFGKVRSMTASGLRRKFDIEAHDPKQE